MLANLDSLAKVPNMYEPPCCDTTLRRFRSLEHKPRDSETEKCDIIWNINIKVQCQVSIVRIVDTRIKGTMSLVCTE